MNIIRAIVLSVSAIGAFAAPVLRLSQTTVGPVSIAQGQNGPTRSLEFTNAGDGTLAVTLTSSASWAVPTMGTPRVCSIAGSLCTPINIALNTSALARGTYTALIRVSDPNATDAPQIITVVVAVGGAVPSSATLYVSPDAGSRDSVPFTTNALLESDVATASGGAWLSLALQGGGSFAFVLPYAIVGTNPGNLAEGTYNGTVVTRGSTLGDDNKTVNVTLRVTSQPIMALNTAPIRFRAAQGAPVQIANLVAANRGRGTLAMQSPAVAMTSGAGWLTADLVAGTNIVQVKAAPGTLGPGTYEGAVTLNSNAANTGVVIPVSFEIVARGAPVLAVGGVVSNATFAQNDTLGRGAIAAAFGEQFVFGDPVAAPSLPLGTTLGGVRVLVNGVAAPVYFSSYGQINFQVPYEAAEGRANIVVEANGQRSNAVTVAIANRAPRILRFNIGEYGILVNQDGTFPVPRNTALGSLGRPARPGETLVMYAIGLGPTSPAVTNGIAAPSSPLAVVPGMIGVALGNNGSAPDDQIRPLFVGLTPGFVGLYQINFTIPGSAQRGERVRLYLDLGNNVTSNIVELAIE